MIKIALKLVSDPDVRRIAVGTLFTLIFITIIVPIISIFTIMTSLSLTASSRGLITDPINEPYKITVLYGAEDDEYLGEGSKHFGNDYVYTGDKNDNHGEILAVANGEVTEINNSCPSPGLGLEDTCGGGFGNYVKIKFTVAGKQYYALYGHLSKVDVKVGDKVIKSQSMGLTGSSGKSTGEHLHFQMYDSTGKTIDPNPFLSNITSQKKELMLAAGISVSDFTYVDYIVGKESSWDFLATNQESGAYGLCQALPPEKMASAGEDWLTNPVTQLKWCDMYAKERYETWKNAYEFWIENHWW